MVSASSQAVWLARRPPLQTVPVVPIMRQLTHGHFFLFRFVVAIRGTQKGCPGKQPLHARCAERCLSEAPVSSCRASASVYRYRFGLFTRTPCSLYAVFRLSAAPQGATATTTVPTPRRVSRVIFVCQLAGLPAYPPATANRRWPDERPCRALQPPPRWSGVPASRGRSAHRVAALRALP